MVINMLKKIEYTKSNLLNKKIENIFTCPICHSNIKIYKNSLICEKIIATILQKRAILHY